MSVLSPAQLTPASAPAPATLGGVRQALLASGRLCEISGTASSGKSTLALDLCCQVMREGDVAAWIDPTGTFWPLAALEQQGRLDRLLVVRVPDGPQALRAADMLLSSPGAVALAVVHLPPRFRPSDGQLFRLQRLAEKSATPVLFLDERPAQAPSLGPSIAVRVQAGRSTKDGWSLRLEVVQHKAGSRGPVKGELRHYPERLASNRTL